MNLFSSLLLPLGLLLFSLTFVSTGVAAAAAAPERYTVSRRPPTASNVPPPQEYFDPTFPPVLLPAGDPACSLSLLRHDFAHTYGLPPATAPYDPPEACPPPWSAVVLDLSVSCAGEQYDRVAAVWLDGAELLRTTTAEPTESGVFWRVRKDITRYAALLRREAGGVLSMMLENIVDDVFTGVYHVNISMDFYLGDTHKPSSMEFHPHLMLPHSNEGRLVERDPHSAEKFDFSSPGADDKIGKTPKTLSLYTEPADLIIPISNNDSTDGSWFRIRNESDVNSKSIEIPSNTHRAVLEVFVSFHENDEFWYYNPPNSYIEKNNLTTGRGNGGFREVVAKIDEQYVGSFVPFPVIFTGGINPLFWAPVVALGAFDLPSYTLDLSPFLSFLLDGKPHNLSLSVTDGINVWLVDANLHLWLDAQPCPVSAGIILYQAPNLAVTRDYVFNQLNGTFMIEAGRKSHFEGWVKSSLGNLTFHVDQKQKFKSSVKFTDDGKNKLVYMKAKSKTDVRIREGPKTVVAQGSHKYKHPLVMSIVTLPGENDTYITKSNISHTFYVQTSVTANKVIKTSSIVDRQNATGWMLVQDHSVLDGAASSEQAYQYKDDDGVYLRKVSVRDGLLVGDNTTNYPGFASF